MRITKKTAATAALLTALAVGTAVPAAFALGATEAATEGEAPTRAERREAARAEFAAALAQELGIGVDRVADAIEQVTADLAEQHHAEHRAALKERLDAAVADGSITQEQADAMLTAHDAGLLRGFGGHRHHRGPGGPGHDAPREGRPSGEPARSSSAS